MIEGPMQAIEVAAGNLDRYRDAPAGRVRINVLEDAVGLLLEPVMPIFVDRYPAVAIDISVSNRMVDVVGAGFDAGIRYGGTVPEDMIAQRLSPDMRWGAAASPAYIERFGVPANPQDLSNHRCVGIRLGNDQLYRWEFEQDDEEVSIATPGPLTVDASHAAIAFGLRGAGIIYASEAMLRPHLDRGALQRVLPEWSSMGSGFHVYYPGRRHLPTALRLLVDLIKELRPLGI